MNYWTKVVENPENPEYAFAKKMVYKQKVVLKKHSTNRLGQIRCWQKAIL